MSRKSVGVLSIILLAALALVGCDLVGIVGINKNYLQIQGTVVDEENRPIEDVAVFLDSNGVGLTGPSGTWSYDKALKGSKVTVQKSGLTFSPESITVEKDGQILWFDGTKISEDSDGTYSISGKVVDSEGQGVPAVTITIAGDTEATIITDSNGEFSKDGLTGSVKITGAKEGLIFDGTFDVSGPEDNLTFVARPAGVAYGVSGQVLSTGGLPIEGVVISFEDEDGTRHTAVSDQQGLFSKSGLVGQMTASAYLEGWDFTPESRIVNGEETELNFYGTPDSERTYEVQGAVVYADGMPVPGVSLRFDFLDLDREPLYTVTSLEGIWGLDGLIGRVRITPIKEGLTFLPVSQITDKAAMSLGFRVQ